MAEYKSPEEIDRANRMFAVTEAVKLAKDAEHAVALEDNFRAIHTFMSEAAPIPEPQVGFSAD